MWSAREAAILRESSLTPVKTDQAQDMPANFLVPKALREVKDDIGSELIGAVD